ncbi:MAG: phosphotransferase [Chloroflexota bacterium]
MLNQTSVLSFTTEMLGPGKGMTGQLVRLSLVYSRPDAAGPRSLIAKFSAPNPQMRGPLHSMGFYEREMRFYEQIAPQSLLRTPRCYFSAVDPEEGLSLLLLEDLSYARNGSAVEDCSVADAELAVIGIASFHAQWWQHPLLDGQDWLEMRGFLAASQVQATFDLSWAPFLSIISDSLAEQIVPLSDDLHRHLGRISTYLYMDGPRTLIHNDYHAENLFFVGAGHDGSIAVVDWQVATLGRGVIDVARFLGGNLHPNARREHDLRLLRSYHKILLENGVSNYSFEQCWYEYRLAMLLPLGLIAMVMGLAARVTAGPDAMKGGPREVIVTRYCRAITDLKVSDLLMASVEERDVAHGPPICP